MWLFGRAIHNFEQLNFKQQEASRHDFQPVPQLPQNERGIYGLRKN
jgi:hypothetical protein